MHINLRYGTDWSHNLTDTPRKVRMLATISSCSAIRWVRRTH